MISLNNLPRESECAHYVAVGVHHMGRYGPQVRVPGLSRMLEEGVIPVYFMVSVEG